MNTSDGIRTTARTIDVENIHSNVTPEILEITIDKLRIVLLENEKSMTSTNEWQTPFALLLSIVLSLCTAEFRAAFGIKSEVWSAIFILAAALTAIWFIKTLFSRGRRMTIDELIACMKKRA